MGAARTLGILTGLVALLSLLVLGRPESREPRLGASLEVTVAESGGIELSRQDPLPVLEDPDLKEGEAAHGRLRARNISAKPLEVRFVMTAAGESIGTVAAGQIWVRIAQGGSELARTNAPGLAAGSSGVVIAPGDVKTFDFQAWIGGDKPALYAGQDVVGRLAVQVSPRQGSHL